MSKTQVGSRVGAILSSSKTEVQLLGFGVYDGEHEPPFGPFGAPKEQHDKMREIIAASNLPCVYCGLPADQWLQCSSGFPGCARGDDAMCGPNQGLSKQEQEKQ